MRIPLILRIAALVVAATAFYTYVGRLVPQKEVYPPAEVEMKANMSTDEMVKVGHQIMEGKGMCFTCHTVDKGGVNKVGPNQWDIVGRKKASHEGFSYSSALQSKGGDWTYEDINHMIFKPQAFVRGTKMAFAGLAKEQDRADVIAYLRTMSDTPAPLP